ncbi:MAG: hypothetical protein IBX55_00635 [Methyloprofundus sp.]|nr:hypothetical protein [Methyloprofundus sp.]
MLNFARLLNRLFRFLKVFIWKTIGLFSALLGVWFLVEALFNKPIFYEVQAYLSLAIIFWSLILTYDAYKNTKFFIALMGLEENK